MTALARLDHLAVLRVSGPDRVALLQGQTSNDVRRVDAARAQLTSFNGPKGRCYAVAVLAAWDDQHLLVVERSVAELLCKRLRMYILRSKAAVEPAADLAAVGSHGDHRELPRDFSAARLDDALAVRMPGGRELLIGPAARAAALADGDDAWRRADVAVGLASVTAETVERFVPLWLGLERWGAIDYQKGCYTGQEIVARTHYLGTVKQQLRRARSAVATRPGAKVLGDGDQPVGEVVSVAPRAHGDGHDLLFAGRAARAWSLGPDQPLTEVAAFE